MVILDDFQIKPNANEKNEKRFGMIWMILNSSNSVVDAFRYWKKFSSNFTCCASASFLGPATFASAVCLTGNGGFNTSKANRRCCPAKIFCPGANLMFFSTVWVMGTFLESPKGPASTAGTTYGFLGFLQFLPYFADWVSSAGWNALAFVLSLDFRCLCDRVIQGPCLPTSSDQAVLMFLTCRGHVYWQVVSPTELCREPSSVARAPRK